jgi:nucleoside-diphosphate-sugar epimerase
MSKLIFGCGYLGRRVAQRWRAAGEVVYAVTRHPATAATVAPLGLTPILADITQPETLKNLPEADEILFAVGHDHQAGPSLPNVYVRGLGNVLAAIDEPPRRFVYVSSTGVYGQTQGQTIDETSPCQSTRAGGVACLAAENLLRASRLADRALVLRLAGIYGPGRIPRVEDVRAGRPITAPSDGYLNLIHVDDAADLIATGLSDIAPPELFVVSDGNPVLRRDYYAELARLLQSPPPQFVPPSPESHAAQRAGSDKRINPARLMAVAARQWRYPTYREGLAAILAAEARQLRDRLN